MSSTFEGFVPVDVFVGARVELSRNRNILLIIGFGGLFGESPDRWKTGLREVSGALVEIDLHFFLDF